MVPVLLLLASCDRPARPEAPTGARIACALDGAAALADVCTARRTVRDGRAVLTLTRPDGGFRRLEASADRTGIAAADGATRVRADAVAEEVTVEIDGNRYRLPATGR